MTNNSYLSCPHCGQLDKVQKISALYTEGTTHTSYETPSAAVKVNDTTFYGTQERTAISRTALSERLRPPSIPDIKRPKQNAVFTKPEGYIGSIIGFILMIGIGIGGFIIAASVSDKNSVLQWCGTLGVLIIIIMPFVAIKQIIDIARGKHTKQNNEFELDWYNRTMQKYELAKGRWDSAYYCGRCDGIFTPGLGRFTPINQFSQFLNE